MGIKVHTPRVEIDLKVTCNDCGRKRLSYIKILGYDFVILLVQSCKACHPKDEDMEVVFSSRAYAEGGTQLPYRLHMGEGDPINQGISEFNLFSATTILKQELV